MSSYVLYIPGVQGANPKHLDAVGLSGLTKDGSPEFADCLNGGPDKGKGVVAAWRTGNTDTDPSFSPSDFAWKPAKACKARELPAKRFWFGVDPKRPVAPKSILRKQMSLGYDVTLRDGQVWHIPTAVNLPHVHGLNGDGEFERQVADEHRAFWMASEQYAVEFFRAIDKLAMLQSKRPKANTEQVVKFTLADAWSYCNQALAINYRLTPEIVDFLGLLDDTAVRNIIKATIDLPCIMEDHAQKKTDDLTIPVG